MISLEDTKKRFFDWINVTKKPFYLIYLDFMGQKR